MRVARQASIQDLKIVRTKIVKPIPRSSTERKCVSSACVGRKNESGMFIMQLYSSLCSGFSLLNLSAAGIQSESWNEKRCWNCREIDSTAKQVAKVRRDCIFDLKSWVRADALKLLVTIPGWLVGSENFEITRNISFTHNFSQISQKAIPIVFQLPVPREDSITHEAA